MTRPNSTQGVFYNFKTGEGWGGRDTHTGINLCGRNVY